MRIYLSLMLLPISILAHAGDCPDAPAKAANECLANKLQALEATLERTYSELQGAIPIREVDKEEIANELLENSENSWLLYRNAHCVFEGFIEGGAGSYKTTREYKCLVQLTDQRATELANLRKHDYE